MEQELITLPEFAPVLHVLLWFVLFMLSNYMTCVAISSAISRKNNVRFVFTLICFVGDSCFIICIYLRIQMSNTISISDHVRAVKRRPGTDNPSGVHPRFLVGSCCSTYSFLCNVYQIIVLFLPIVLPVLLFTALHYPFDIFNLSSMKLFFT